MFENLKINAKYNNLPKKGNKVITINNYKSHYNYVKVITFKEGRNKIPDN